MSCATTTAPVHLGAAISRTAAARHHAEPHRLPASRRQHVHRTALPHLKGGGRLAQRVHELRRSPGRDQRLGHRLQQHRRTTASAGTPSPPKPAPERSTNTKPRPERQAAKGSLRRPGASGACVFGRSGRSLGRRSALVMRACARTTRARAGPSPSETPSEDAPGLR